MLVLTLFKYCACLEHKLASRSKNTNACACFVLCLTDTNACACFVLCLTAIGLAAQS